jgi:hypothetical protein
LKNLKLALNYYDIGTTGTAAQSNSSCMKSQSLQDSLAAAFMENVSENHISN